MSIQYFLSPSIDLFALFLKKNPVQVHQVPIDMSTAAHTINSGNAICMYDTVKMVLPLFHLSFFLALDLVRVLVDWRTN